MTQQMNQQMSQAQQRTEQKSFDKPDETRSFENGAVDLLTIGDSEIGRLVLQPGWRWSEHVKPIAGTDLCEAPHFQYHLSGVLAVKMDDGTILECRAGDVSLLPTGHDAWVIGDEPAIVIDFQGMLDYAAKSH